MQCLTSFSLVPLRCGTRAWIIGVFGVLSVCLTGVSVWGASVERWSLAERFARADAVMLAQAMDVEGRLDTERDQRYTRVVLRVQEVFKETVPDHLALRLPGGVVGGEGAYDSLMPTRSLQPPLIYFVWQTERGVELMHGDADVWPADAERLAALRAMGSAAGGDLRSAAAKARFFQSASVTSNGVYANARRFPRVDRGEAIPVIPDLEFMPAGITTNQALTALANALAAWEDAASIRFALQPPTVFGQDVDLVETDEEVIRVQFHDTYADIPDDSGTLGVGGSGYWVENGGGATVKGLAFYPSKDGTVVLNHDKASLEDPVTLESTLAHEIGHVIGLAHSSETSGETNGLLAEAMMFYVVHNDGRGATLGAWDEAAIQLIHPLDNIPPYGFERVMLAITSPSALSNAVVNSLTVVGADLDEDVLTVDWVETNGINGVFFFADNAVTYEPNAYYLEGDGNFDSISYRWFDGTNYSAIVDVDIIGFREDTEPSGQPDGLLDSWMTNYFGAAAPVAGVSGPDDDPDGDGLSNLVEFRLGSNPQDPSDAFQIPSFDGETISVSVAAGQVYRIEQSTNLVTWTTVAYLPDSTGSTNGWRLPLGGDAVANYRVVRIW